MGKKYYVTRIKGFDVDKMVATTLLFLGTKKEVKEQQKKIYAIAKRFNGMPAGAENGKRGYFLTYMIAYLRDFGFSYHFLAESFETSVPWHSVTKLIRRVKARLADVCREKGVVHPPFLSARVTQTYETGACIYFYFGFVYKGLKNPLKAFEEIESAARDEVIVCGGSLSHHHGVGKLRKKWVESTLSSAGVEMLRGVKLRLDPKNIMAANNLIPG